jgi:hypothetical protein
MVLIHNVRYDTWIDFGIKALSSATFVIAREGAELERWRCRPIFMATYVRMFIMNRRAWIRPSQHTDFNVRVE